MFISPRFAPLDTPQYIKMCLLSHPKISQTDIAIENTIFQGERRIVYIRVATEIVSYLKSNGTSREEDGGEYWDIAGFMGTATFGTAKESRPPAPLPANFRTPFHLKVSK